MSEHDKPLRPAAGAPQLDRERAFAEQRALDRLSARNPKTRTDEAAKPPRGDKPT